MSADEIKKIDMLFVVKRTRILGIAILTGMTLVYLIGIFVSSQNVNEELAFVNLYSFIFCVALCAVSLLLKRMLFAKVNQKNFAAQYFNAHVLPFALCDLGGLICIMSNLFVNSNLVYATAGFVITAAVMILNFPKNDDYSRIGL